ncbi:MAG: site-2 protease family protein [Proteobacteria bacterium]|nr:site-2 protease family protein [Pseudomonadota bacterium]
MIRGIKLFKVQDIVISIDYSWFIVFFLVAWSMAYGYFPYYTPGLAVRTYLTMGILSSLFLFSCVLIHELSHSVTSNRLGIEVKEITLFLFGGIAKLTKEPEKALDELKIAIAGPAASALLAALFYLIRMLLASFSHEEMVVVDAILSFLIRINIVLLIFNMIPGLPLDGGRVLKALWWMKSGDIKMATRVASEVGRFFAAVLIFFGFMQLVSGNLAGGLWAVLIGMFLMQSAGSNFRQMQFQRETKGLKVSEIMTTDVITLEGNTTLTRALEEYFFKHHFVSFPVTKLGNISGLLTLSNIKSTHKELWDETLAGEVMLPFKVEASLKPDDELMQALKIMGDTGQGRLLVMDGDTLAGIISKRDILKTLQIKEVFEKR